MTDPAESRLILRGISALNRRLPEGARPRVRGETLAQRHVHLTKGTTGLRV